MAVHSERVDDAQANPARAGHEMGAPTYLSTEQVEQLHAASELVAKPFPFTYIEGVIGLVVELLPHAVAAITLEFPAQVPEQSSPKAGG